MAANTVVLMVIVALAGLVLACIAVAVRYKTRTLARDVQPHTFRDRAEAVELRAVYEKAVADDDPATAYAAEVEAGLTDVRLHEPNVQPAA
jgi:hypothetical protein